MAALFFFGGCSNDDSTADGGASPKAEIEKWNFYVDFGNHLETDLNQALSGYFKAFGDQPDYRAPASSDYIADFVEAMGVDKLLTRDIEQALSSARSSDSELDQVTYEMTLQLQTLWTRLRLARDYHSGRAQSFGVADQAQQLHREIFESYLGLEATYSRFRQILNKSDAERRQADLREMRAKGLIVRPAMLQLIDDSQVIQDLFLAKGLDSGNLSDLSLEEFQPYYEKVMDSLTALEEALDKIDKPGREALSADMLPRFRDQSKRMVDSLNLLLEGLRLPDFSQSANLQNATSATENFATELGDLVDLYNNSAQ